MRHARDCTAATRLQLLLLSIFPAAHATGFYAAGNKSLHNHTHHNNNKQLIDEPQSYNLFSPRCIQHTVAPGWTAGYLQLSDVSLWPCTNWGDVKKDIHGPSDEGDGCKDPPIVSHPDAEVVNAIGAATRACNREDHWFKKLPHDGVAARTRPHAKAVATEEVALLMDTWGTTSLYHSVIDTLFTTFVTLHAHFGRHDACVSGGSGASASRCSVFLVHRHNWPAERPFAQEVAKLLFGGLIPAKSIEPKVYKTVLVGSLMNAYTPLRWPDIHLRHLKLRAIVEPAWRGFTDALRMQLVRTNVIDANPTSETDGVWIWRAEEKYGGGGVTGRRYLLPEEAAAIEEVTRDATTGANWLKPSRMHELSFAQQAKLMSETRLLAGLEGAGFVNQLLMPRGGVTVIISPWDDGDRAWQWSYGMYHAKRLVYINLNKAQLSVPLAKAIGRLLQAVHSNCEAPLPPLPCGAVVVHNDKPLGPADTSACSSEARRSWVLSGDECGSKFHSATAAPVVSNNHGSNHGSSNHGHQQPASHSPPLTKHTTKPAPTAATPRRASGTTPSTQASSSGLLSSLSKLVGRS